MSFTDTEKHCLWGCVAATAASKSDVNVAMPHLRGKWSPTKAILRTLDVSFMRHFCAAAHCFPSNRFSGLRHEREMKRIPQVLQLPVVIHPGRLLSFEFHRFQKLDFLFSGIAT